jgi:ferredoxin
VLRSRTPELVAQEVWADLLVHYALRQVIHTAALAEDLDPTGCRLSAACGSCAAS